MSNYIQISSIKGNVSAKGYENWIQIQNIRFSTQRRVEMIPGRGANREASTPQLSTITITKLADQTSPMLMQYALTKQTFDTIKIHCCRTAKDKLTPMHEWELSNVMISSYQTQKGAEESPALERLTLYFTKIQQRFNSTDAKQNTSSPITSGYDVASATVV